MYKKILSGIAIIYLLGLNTVSALYVKSYDLSGLGNLIGDDNQYIDSITITDTSDIVLNVEFYDCNTNNEMRIEFLGTTFSMGCKQGPNNTYYNTSGAWYNVMPGTYELYLLTNTAFNNWGAREIKLYISEQGMVGGGGDTNNNIEFNEINSEQEAKKIYLFSEYDDMVVFFQQISEVYYLILILMFLYTMFNKKDYELGL